MEGDGGTRTHNHRLRRHVFYPIEIRRHFKLIIYPYINIIK